MNKIKVLVVEDEWIVSQEITEILESNNFEVIGQAADAKKALELVSSNPPDVALLDINIKGEIDGIELAKSLRRKFSLAIVFLTAYSDNQSVNRAKEVNPQSFLVKPFNEKNVIIALELAAQNIANGNQQKDYYTLDDRLFLKENRRFYRIMLDEIKYVHADGSYCQIVTDSSRITLSCNLKKIENVLTKPNFLRVHRSFVINIERIDAFEGNTVFINNERIPISQTFKEELTSKLNLL